jgi:hypothetical protein
MFYTIGMDWGLAIDRHRQALLRIVATLFAIIGLAKGGSVERLPWPLYRAVLRVLRPAEAAVRRLIIVAARNMVVKPSPERSAPSGHKRSGKGKGQGRRRILFQLVDPHERFAPSRQKKKAVVRAEPRIRVLDFDPRVPLFARPGVIAPDPAPKPKRAPGETANAASLCRRLAAIKGALEDLAAQARRYARWWAKPMEKRRPKRASALRPGDPPGYRKRPSHEVDRILSACDWLALSAPQPDTS